MSDTAESLLREVVDLFEAKSKPGNWQRPSCPFCGAWLHFDPPLSHSDPDPRLNGPGAQPCLVLRAERVLASLSSKDGA